MEGSIHALVAFLAAIVALQYFVIAFYVAPRLSRLVDSPNRLITATRFGAMFFFVGCAMTHIGIVVHVLTGDVAGYGNPAHAAVAHVIPHLAQIVGGGTFTWIVHRHLDVRFHDKKYAILEAEKAALMEHLQLLATRDHLTGLLNRRAFDQELEAHARFVERYGASGGVLYLDLDYFKAANDRLGHASGDLLLQHAATALTRATRGTDVVARLGGDEFAVLLRHAGPRECEGVAERIVTEIGRIHEPASITASVGAATWCTDVIEHADAAMYAAKRSGGNCYLLG